MSGLLDQDEFPGDRPIRLEDVRRLEIAYSCVRPGEGPASSSMLGAGSRY